MRCADGYLNCSEISRALSQILDWPGIYLPDSRTRLPDGQTGAEGNWPGVGFRCDGYTMLKKVSTTPRARVFLAEVEMGRLLRVVKFSDARNEEQLDAVRKIRALADNGPEAKKLMIPIDFANNCSAGPWCMIVLACLDDAGPGRSITPELYQPLTFGEWITRQHSDRSLDSQDRWAVIEHIKEILRALDVFHSKDLVMNDAKPDNFGFYEKRLVIIDYEQLARRGRLHAASTIWPTTRLRNEKEDGGRCLCSGRHVGRGSVQPASGGAETPDGGIPGEALSQ